MGDAFGSYPLTNQLWIVAEGEPCFTNVFGLGAIKFGGSQSLGLAVTVMGYVFHTRGWPLRLLFADSKSERGTPTAT